MLRCRLQCREPRYRTDWRRICTERHASLSEAQRRTPLRKSWKPTRHLRSINLRRTRSTSDDSPSIAETSKPVDPPNPEPEADSHSSDSTSEAKKKLRWADLIPRPIRLYWCQSEAARYLKDTAHMLWRNLWTLLSLTVLNSAARFLLVWTLYRTVCLVAVQFFGVSVDSIPSEMIPTAESTGDPDIYQQLADITFLLFKPFDFLLKGIFIAAGLLVCWESIQETLTSDGAGRFKWFRDICKGVKSSLLTSWSSLKMSPRYILAYVVIGALSSFYQGLCLLIIPFLYAIQRLMNIQLGLCVTLLDKLKVKEALEESTKLVEPVRKHLYVPYLFLFLTPNGYGLEKLMGSCDVHRLLGVARDLVVKVFPDRLFVDIPEMTWGVIAATTVTAFMIDRMAEIFPIVVYSATKSKKIKD